MSSWLHFALLVVLGLGVCAEKGCPPPEDIEPCICTDFPSTRLTCDSLLDTQTLQKVFNNSERYFYHEVLIRNSTFPFIPSEILNKTHVGELFVVDSNMVSIFNDPPKSESLYKIQLDRVHFQRNDLFQTDVLKYLTSLRTIVINKSTIKEIFEDFGSRLPTSIRQITFNDTAIKRIHIGAFNSLYNLDRLAIHFSKLPNLTRSMFPRPFYARFLYLDHNNIDSVPSDIFTEMPNLQFLTLRNNFLSTLPEEAFRGKSSNVPYIGLEGNPLNCNCLLVWLVRDKPEVIDGTCSKPSRLQGKSLQDLVPADFNC